MAGARCVGAASPASRWSGDRDPARTSLSARGSHRRSVIDAGLICPGHSARTPEIRRRSAYWIVPPPGCGCRRRSPGFRSRREVPQLIERNSGRPKRPRSRNRAAAQSRERGVVHSLPAEEGGYRWSTAGRCRSRSRLDSPPRHSRLATRMHTITLLRKWCSNRLVGHRAGAPAPCSRGVVIEDRSAAAGIRVLERAARELAEDVVETYSGPDSWAPRTAR